MLIARLTSCIFGGALAVRDETPGAHCMMGAGCPLFDMLNMNLL